MVEAEPLVDGEVPEAAEPLADPDADAEADAALEDALVGAGAVPAARTENSPLVA